MKIPEMATLLQEFSTLRATMGAERIQAMESFLIEYSATQPLFYADRIDKFNVFTVLGIAEAETIHTQFLAWLLAADSEHGEKNTFLHAFLKAAGLHTQVYIESGYTVITEYWLQNAIIDLVVYQPKKFVIYLENKIYADEGHRQLAREYSDMRRFGEMYHIPLEKQFAVFLTPTGRPGKSAGNTPWIPLSYARLTDEFTHIVKEMSQFKSRLIITDWLDNTRKWGGFYG